MAEIWGAAIVAGAAIYSSSQQKSAANKASKAQQNGANQAAQASEQNYQRTSDNLTPYITAGGSALSQMQHLNAGDYSSFTASPDYQFSMSQGLQGLDRSAAARGSLYSGGHSADVMNYAQGLASQNYNDYYSRLSGLANNGQNAATNLGSVGTGNAAAIGTAATNAGNAQANGYINNANSNSQMAGSLAGAFGQYMGNRGATNSSYSLGGSGTAPYQVSGGTMQNGTFDFTKASGGSY